MNATDSTPAVPASTFDALVPADIRHSFYVDGQWREAADRATSPVVNPATEQAFAAVPMGTAADVDAAVAAARRAAAREPDRLESEAQAFFERVRKGYGARLQGDPQRFARIDADAPLAVVRERVLDTLHRALHA